MDLQNYFKDLKEKKKLYLKTNETTQLVLQSIYAEAKKTIGAKKFLNKIGSTKQVFREILNGKILPSLSLIERIEITSKIKINETFFNSTEYMRGKTHSTTIKLPKKITPELLYLLGGLRDGSLVHYSSVYEIEYGQKIREWLDVSISPRLKKVFEIETKSYKRKNENFVIRKRSVAMFNILNYFLGFPETSYKKTPFIALNIPFELQKYYIGGFYDAEGCKDPKDITFYQQWYDDKGCPPLLDIQAMLKKVGIKTHFRIKSQNNAYLYDLHVEGDSKKKFIEIIPIEHPIFRRNL